MKKLFPILYVFLITIGFVSCLEERDKILYIWDEPAIVRYIDQKPMLETAYGRFVAPSLSDTLSEGNCLWVSFIVNMDDQPNSVDTTLTNLKYKKINHSPIKMAGGNMKDEFTDNIASSLMYLSSVDQMLFFEFTQYAAPGKQIEFEMICNTDSIEQKDGNNVYNIYLRSRIIGGAASGTDKIKTIYGFDMKEFISRYMDPQSKMIKFNLKYKNGESAEGNDLYKPFYSNTFTYTPNITSF